MAQNIFERPQVLIGLACVVGLVVAALFSVRMGILVPVLLVICLAFKEVMKGKRETMTVSGAVLFVIGLVSVYVSRVVIPRAIRTEISQSNNIYALESLQSSQGLADVIGFGFGALGLVLLLVGLLQVKTRR